MVTLSSGATVADPVWSIQPTWSEPYLTYDYTPQELGLSNYSSNGATGSWGAIGLAISILKYDYNVRGLGFNALGLNITGYAGVRDDLPTNTQPTGGYWYSIQWMRIEVYKINYYWMQRLEFFKSLLSGYNLKPRYILYSKEQEDQLLRIIAFGTAVAFSAASLAATAAGIPIGAYITVSSMVTGTAFFVGKSLSQDDWRLLVDETEDKKAVVTWDAPVQLNEYNVRDGTGSAGFLWWIKPGYSGYYIGVKLTVKFIKQQMQARRGAVIVGSEEVSTSCTLYLYKPWSSKRSIIPTGLQKVSIKVSESSPAALNVLESQNLEEEA